MRTRSIARGSRSAENGLASTARIGRLSIAPGQLLRLTGVVAVAPPVVEIGLGELFGPDDQKVLAFFSSAALVKLNEPVMTTDRSIRMILLWAIA